MFLCYIDESGTPEIPGNSSHFVLAALAIPVWLWKSSESQIAGVKYKYGLQSAEIHAGWMLRPYAEQMKVRNFDKLTYVQRRYEVERLRNSELLRLQRSSNRKLHSQTKKNYEKTRPYVHLTYSDRKAFIEEIAQIAGEWGYARLFAECIDKIHFNPSKTRQSVDEQAFEQVVSRFEQFLRLTNSGQTTKSLGLLIHDNNVTVAKRHTELMKSFHQVGTLWTQIENIIETPLFVDSELTSMVQVADLCAYSIRRYVENNESVLFDHVFKRADRKDGIVVGVRHFTGPSCVCKICLAHRVRPTGESTESIR